MSALPTVTFTKVRTVNHGAKIAMFLAMVRATPILRVNPLLGIKTISTWAFMMLAVA